MLMSDSLVRGSILRRAWMPLRQVRAQLRQAWTRLRQARTRLRQARTLLRQASDKSKIDILKTILTDFFADSGAEYVT